MVKVTRGIIDKCGVYRDATLCVVILKSFLFVEVKFIVT